VELAGCVELAENFDEPAGLLSEDPSLASGEASAVIAGESVAIAGP